MQHHYGALHLNLTQSDFQLVLQCVGVNRNEIENIVHNFTAHDNVIQIVQRTKRFANMIQSRAQQNLSYAEIYLIKLALLSAHRKKLMVVEKNNEGETNLRAQTRSS